ncbi:MAG TPA: hypothetical protein VL547_10370 [Dinghuibacter sp.]|uniref:hypothetical protein n=1 Tax=Dinghuibacter sp. TaxID=2024697 RepID=UPI002B5740BD|nr:hypothetical protein [Dinghuibacter sp.]HTJ12421.1 hypothetical protein [Dinghuibacter sp.]
MFRRKSIPLTAMMGLLLLAGVAVHATTYHFTGTGGDKKKDAHKDTPVVIPFSNLKSAESLQLSLKSGMQPGFRFTGDFSIPAARPQDQTLLDVHSLMTYQQGNTIYIYPYKQPMLLAKFRTPERPH